MGPVVPQVTVPAKPDRCLSLECPRKRGRSAGLDSMPLRMSGRALGTRRGRAARLPGRGQGVEPVIGQPPEPVQHAQSRVGVVPILEPVLPVQVIVLRLDGRLAVLLVWQGPRDNELQVRVPGFVVAAPLTRSVALAGLGYRSVDSIDEPAPAFQPIELDAHRRGAVLPALPARGSPHRRGPCHHSQPSHSPWRLVVTSAREFIDSSVTAPNNAHRYAGIPT